MILITGAAGFIGSCLVQHLNELGHDDLILVDDFTNAQKNLNLLTKQFYKKVHRDQLFDWLQIHQKDIHFVFHLGARTDTTEQNRQLFQILNLTYSKKIWQFCTRQVIPLVYASSAATYGAGEFGYTDNHQFVEQLQPLNPYGQSKQDFDVWALQQVKHPPYWQGLKFFNVYGPNEYHKGRMASVIWHTFRQIQQTGRMQLFRSHRPDFADGQQSRDFIYVKDVLQVCNFLYQQKTRNGLYNVGTGIARSFYDLANTTFQALELPTQIYYIDTPEDIRATYQYFTKAEMQKMQIAGYNLPFYSLEAGISDYVQTYLVSKSYY